MKCIVLLLAAVACASAAPQFFGGLYHRGLYDLAVHGLPAGVGGMRVVLRKRRDAAEDQEAMASAFLQYAANCAGYGGIYYRKKRSAEEHPDLQAKESAQIYMTGLPYIYDYGFPYIYRKKRSAEEDQQGQESAFYPYPYGLGYPVGLGYNYFYKK